MALPITPPASAPDKGHLNLGGHKISYDALFIGLAGVAGTFFLLRSRSSSGAGTVIVPSGTSTQAAPTLMPTGLDLSGLTGAPGPVGPAGPAGPAGAPGALPNAGPTPAPAPTAPTIVTSGPALGTIFGTPDPGWTGGLGEWKISVPDIYGAASSGQPGYGSHGAGANEVAAYVNSLNPQANLTPDQLAAWNQGQKWYQPGQQLYVGSFKQGVGH